MTDTQSGAAPASQPASNNLPFMSAADVRRAFLEFFRARGHSVVASSSLIPGNDPTLLFTNAGMVQFKDCFLGKEKRAYVRAASSQRCVRAGGKHNDLENVGYTARHHTFFEMLGNFSFGDYFKRDAIRFAWEFVTGTLGLAPQRLWVTVFKDDNEAADIWIKEMGVPANRLTRMGEQSNFWAMGDTGPCGPCSEIFYDHGAHIAGGPPGTPDEDGDRFVEIWNLVFMQYERAADGKLTPLPKPSVDTGAGLERLSAVMQGVHSNYDIDLFRKLLAATAALAATTDTGNPSLRVIADHIRACSFLIVDGVTPSNEGRGYVLRRIIRRAIRHGYKLGIQGAFFYQLVKTLDEEMGAAFPELTAARAHVERVLRQEEERFAETLATGMSLLDAAIGKLGSSKIIDGETVFKLYDTYGFPADLTADVARERGLAIDQTGFDSAMDAQRARARGASRFGSDTWSVSWAESAQTLARSNFCGYDSTSGQGIVVAILKEGAPVQVLQTGERGEIVLDQTPFYAESGGQVGDTGVLQGANGARFSVDDTHKRGAAIAHAGVLTEGAVGVGDTLSAQVDEQRRDATRRNHSATHLLHAALRQLLGKHVQQKGSLVAPDRLRFDFSHIAAVTPDELLQIEQFVNAQVRANTVAETTVRSYDDAVAAGAIALFGEKYAADVRVLKIGDFSMELCGGTHVSRAGDIGLFKIVSEGGVAAGVRRIEAVTGEGALALVEANEKELRAAAGLLRGQPTELANKVRDALERIRQLEKENRQLKDKLASGAGTDIAAGAVDVGGIQVVATQIEGADAGALRNAVDGLKDRLKKAVVVLATTDAGGKITVVAGVTAAESAKLKAGEIIAMVAAQIGGKGGGRPDFAQGGGTDATKLSGALAGVAAWVKAKIAP